MNIKKYITVICIFLLSVSFLLSQQINRIFPYNSNDTTGVYLLFEGEINFEQDIQKSESTVTLIFPNTSLTEGNSQEWVDLPPLYRIEAQETISNKHYKHSRIRLNFNEIPEFKINQIGENVLQIIWPSQPREPIVIIEEDGSELNVWSNFENQVSMNLKNADLVDVLRLIAVQNNMNLVTNNEIVGKATVTLRDVNVRTALDAILKVNKYNWFIQDNLIIVSLIEDDIVGGLVSKHYKLEYVDAISVGTALKNVLTEKGNFEVFSPVASSIYFGMMQSGGMQSGGMQGGGMQGGGMQGGGMQGGGMQGGGMQGGGMQGGGMQGGGMQNPSTMSADHIVVTDVYSNFDYIDNIIEGLDVRVQQINIAVKFIETKLDANEKLGIDWSVRSEIIGPVPDAQSSIIDFDNFRLFDSNNLSLYSFSLPVFHSVLELLASDGETRLIQEPQLTTKNNSLATFKVGTSYPVQTTQTTDFLQTTSYEDKEINIVLKVQPRINEGHFISMDISTTVQALVGFAGSNNDYPIISDRSSTTHVRIEDQQTLMIGGLIFDQAIENTSRFPFLSSIPLLGKLFSHSNYVTEQRELLIFISPSIIHQ